MQVKQVNKSDTEVTLTVSAAEAYLEPIKLTTLRKLSGRVKLAGFREGKAPLNLVEKNLDPQVLQSEFLDEAVNRLYASAIQEQKLRPIAPPQISLKKFVPFSEVEFEAELEVLGPIKLADYTKIKKARKNVTVTDKDVQDVIITLQKRTATTKEVDRPSAKNDEVVIDFSGKDSKGEPIQGAEGKDYPLILGSNTFIPGFEEHVVGLKSGEEETFTITFPKDYRPAALAGKKVAFTVQVKKVHELTLPAADDAFASRVGPFKTLSELKVDIKKQLTAQRQNEADRDYESELIQEITAKSSVPVPKTLVTEQIEAMLREPRQNLSYRSQTYSEFLALEGKTDEQYRREVLAPQATERVKAGLVLAEIAEAEKLTVTEAELEARLQELKGQYKDEKIQAELNKPEARRDIASRLLTEKIIQKLAGYAQK